MRSVRRQHARLVGTDTDTDPPCIGDEFEAASVDHALPASSVVSQRPYEVLADSYTLDCVGGGGYGTLRYQTLDLTGDGLLDLVVTEDECTAPDIGRDRWVVYSGVCTTR